VLVLEQLLKTNPDYADEYRLNPNDTAPNVAIHPYALGPFAKKRLKKKVL